MFGAFFVNHIYIDIFLTVKEIDSLFLNLMTWGLLCFNSFNHPCKYYSLVSIRLVSLIISILNYRTDD